MTTPLEWELHPSREKWSSCEARTWLSKCGRLKLYEITDPHPDRREEVIRYGACHRRDDYWDAVETDIKLGPGYPRYYNRFVLAVEAAERYLAERTKDEVQSNKAELVKSYSIEVSISEDEGEEIMTTTTCVLKVNEDKVREMLVEAGFATAPQWTPKRLLSKLKGLPSVKDECQELEGEAKELFDSIVAAIEAGDEVRLESSEDGDAPAKSKKTKGKKAEPEGEDKAEEEEVGEGEEAPPKKAKKANTKKTSVRKGKTEPEENGEEETPKPKKVKVKKTEPEGEEEALVKGKKVKPKGKEKGKTPPKVSGEKRKGVVSTIVEVLKAASKTKPASKEAILNALKKEFPDRSPDGMQTTIKTRLSWGLKQIGYDVHKNDGGYWIP